MKRLLLFLLALVVAGLAILGFAYWTAGRDPVVRRLSVAMSDWPAGAPPLRVVLLSDLHVVGPETPPARIARIVDQVNRLDPDLVLIAGDFEQDRRLSTRHYGPAAAVAPLRALRAPLGVVAVLGNHDYPARGDSDLPKHLAQVGVTLLRNQAVRRGPLAIAGGGDLYHGRFSAAALEHAARALPGPTLVLAHTPDVVPLLPSWYRLVLAGHTHCGQIRLPLLGAPVTASRYGQRYLCGVIREGARTVVVTAGIGTSGVPLRLGAVPDLWLLTIGAPPR
ncbi:metallophosphoesterase [Sphingomonas sp. RS6]